MLKKYSCAKNAALAKQKPSQKNGCTPRVGAHELAALKTRAAFLIACGKHRIVPSECFSSPAYSFCDSQRQ